MLPHVRDSLDVVLIGQELLGEEDLGIRDVASAQLTAGHRARIEVLHGIEDVVPLADRIVVGAAPLWDSRFPTRSRRSISSPLLTGFGSGDS